MSFESQFATSNQYQGRPYLAPFSHNTSMTENYRQQMDDNRAKDAIHYS